MRIGAEHRNQSQERSMRALQAWVHRKHGMEIRRAVNTWSKQCSEGVLATDARRSQAMQACAAV